MRSERVSTLIIAEAGVNHNGSVKLAKELIDSAARAGADAIKFQVFRTEEVVSRDVATVAYQSKGKHLTQFELIKKLELSPNDFKILYDFARKRQIEFIATPFDLSSLVFLSTVLRVKRLKISSGDTTHLSLLLKAAMTGLPILLSTGMTTLDDIRQSLGCLAFGYLRMPGPPSRKAFQRAFLLNKGKAILVRKVTILHCVTAYPAPFEEINLNSLQTLRDEFGLRVGYSDHSLGTSIPIAAVALGARVIEKHLTLDTKMEGPDHQVSLAPSDFRSMVQGIRQIERSMGNGQKAVSKSEKGQKHLILRRLVARKAIAIGDMFSESNVAVLRNSSGAPASQYWDILGKRANRPYRLWDGIRIE